MSSLKEAKRSTGKIIRVEERTNGDIAIVYEEGIPITARGVLVSIIDSDELLTKIFVIPKEKRRKLLPNFVNSEDTEGKLISISENSKGKVIRVLITEDLKENRNPQ